MTDEDTFMGEIEKHIVTVKEAMELINAKLVERGQRPIGHRAMCRLIERRLREGRVAALKVGEVWLIHKNSVDGLYPNVAMRRQKKV